MRLTGCDRTPKASKNAGMCPKTARYLLRKKKKETKENFPRQYRSIVAGIVKTNS